MRKKNCDKVKYNDIREDLCTGDVVLFAGKGIISKVIQWFTKSPYSHIGLVLVDVRWDMVLLWESTTLSKIKTVFGKIKNGVAIRPLSTAIENYKGDIVIRKLDRILSTHQKRVLIKLRQEFKDKKYEESKLQLFKSAYDFIGGKNKRDTSSLFCSELVAEAYQGMALLSLGIPSNEYTPADFAGDISLFMNGLSALYFICKKGECGHG